MAASPPPPESPAKVAESAEPGSLARFKRLAAGLFGVDKERFRESLQRDEEERARRRALARSTRGVEGGAPDHKD
jgi:hypothetical protein